MRIPLLIIAIACASSGHSAGLAGKGTIKKIYTRSYDGVVEVYNASGDWNNPDNCQSSDRLILEGDINFRSEFYSALLASKMANSEIDAWLNGCLEINGANYPVIKGLITY